MIVSVSVLSLQFQRKNGSVLVYIGLDLREILKHSLKEMNEVISKALRKYENLIVMGDFKIDIKCSNSGKDNLQSFCDLFNLTNLAHSETCFMKNSNRSSRHEVFCKKRCS